MSNEPITVTYSLEEVLTRLEQKIDSRFEQIDQRFAKLDQKIDSRFEQVEQKIDNLQQDVTDLKVGQARLEEESKSMREDVKELKNSSKAQIWTLIGKSGY